MPADPALTAVRRAVSPLDHRIEAVTGQDVDTLWAYRDRGVNFYRVLLHRLSNGEFPVDSALLARIDRTVDQLEGAANVRDTAVRRVITSLGPIETAAAAAPVPSDKPLSTADQAVLLAIAGGAKLHEHLLTGRMSVITASGTRISYAELQQMETPAWSPGTPATPCTLANPSH